MKKLRIVLIVFACFLCACNKNISENENKKIKEDIKLSNVWKQTKGEENILIGVLDSGIDISANEMKDSIYVNRLEIPDNNIDDDLNGFIDDINGWNFYDNDNHIYDEYIYDYHGTMVTSLIVNKNIGIAPNVTIVPLKCFRGSEADVNDIVEAIKYGYKLGVRIFNCSWDMNMYNRKLYNIMREYSDAIFVCSAGKNNQNLESEKVFPASFNLNNIIIVGGKKMNGEHYEYSGYGELVDIYGPAENVYCQLPEGDYEYSDGTSLSVAITTGIIALAYSIDNDLQCSDLKKRMSKCNNNFINAEVICGIY